MPEVKRMAPDGKPFPCSRLEQECPRAFLHLAGHDEESRFGQIPSSRVADYSN